MESPLEERGDDRIRTKLAAARTRLILEKPFLGALVLRLPMSEADPKWCRTTATDARRLYYNREYIRQLDIHETQFVLAHEALHCALSHFARREHRDKRRWDIACDYAINPLLMKDAIKAPAGVLIEDSFAGMSAEEIYPYIDENPEQETLDQHLYDNSEGEGEESEGPGQSEAQPKHKPDPSDGDDGGQDQPQQSDGTGDEPAQQPPPLSASEREILGTQWQQHLAGAAQQAIQAGKLSAEIARLVEHLLQPQVPWRALLAEFMSATARDDYSYTRISSRRGDPAIYPSLRSGQVEIVVVVDTSGSIGKQEIAEFISEIDAIKGQVRARITLHACDAQLGRDGPWIYEPWEEMQPPERLGGGGGTNFCPVFDWIEQEGLRPDLLLYFTDGQGRFPTLPPSYPVAWLVKGRTPVPWGRRIQLA